MSGRIFDHGRRAAFALTVLAAAASIAAPNRLNAQAGIPVAIELAFAVDTSLSVDGFEYRLITKGIADAFRTPEIIDLIEQHEGVAVMLFQWGSKVDRRSVIPWHLLTDRASILVFATKVENSERDRNRGFTGIGKAIRFATRQITQNRFDGRHLKVDVAGDGPNNIGIRPEIAGQEAGAFGIVINGLPILTHTGNNSVDLIEHYRERVIRGPGAFYEVANDYEDFARAFRRKLQRELQHQLSHGADPPMPTVKLR